MVFAAFGCGKKVDPQKSFGMYINGREMKAKFKAPEAYLQTLDDGVGYAASRQNGLIIFPLPPPTGPMPRGGIEISFDLKKVSSGKTVQISQSSPSSDVDIYYFPMQGGASVDQGKILSYALRPSKGGSAIIRFDVVEAKIGGKLKGVILEATMDAFYETKDGFNEELSKPRELKLFNWSFETTMKEHPMFSF